MAKISTPIFKGIAPKIAADLLGPYNAQTAQNCKIQDGQLRPWYNSSQDNTLTLTDLIRTLYDLGGYWLEFSADVNIVPSPVSGDTQTRIYYTGDGIPKKTNLAEATTGGGAMPINFYPLPVPTPIAALTATVNPPPAGSGDDRYVIYIWTIVTTWGEEGYPSPATATVTAKEGENVDLSAMTMVWQAGILYAKGNTVFAVGDEGGTYMFVCITPGTSGANEPSWNQTIDGDTWDNTVLWRCFKSNIASKRIYRHATGDQYDRYGLVAEIDVTATTYSDTVLTTGSACPSLGTAKSGGGAADWDPADLDLQGLTYLSNGIILGFIGKDIYASIAYKPWAFPIIYSESIGANIVGIGSTGDMAVIGTDTFPYIIRAIDPSALNITRLPDPRPCVSKRSIVGYKSGVIFASNAGLVFIGSDGSINLLTQKEYSSDEWQALHPSTMHGCIVNNKYFGFYSSGGDEGGIVVDLLTGDITTLSFYTPATYVDLETDTMYYVSGISELLLQEDGTEYPDRTELIYLESGDNLLLE